MAHGDREDILARRHTLPSRAASGFTLLFTLLSLTPATPRNNAEEEAATEAPETHEAAIHKLVLALIFFFVPLSLAASVALVVYTAWIHDLRNGAFALAFAVASSRIAMSFLVWENEEIS